MGCNEIAVLPNDAPVTDLLQRNRKARKYSNRVRLRVTEARNRFILRLFLTALGLFLCALCIGCYAGVLV